MRNQTYHLPNPANDGTPFEGTFDACNEKACPREHQVIAITGKGGVFQLSCEHQLHSYTVLADTPIDSIKADIATILGCQHNEEVCGADLLNGCEHVKKGKCKPKLFHVRGTIPDIIKGTFG